MLSWEDVRSKYTKDPKSLTKNGKPFRISRVTDNAIYLDLPSGEQAISRVLLENAVQLISKGKVIEGPADYRRLVGDERPAYAWAILRDMGFV